MILLQQISYAIKNQLKATKAPYEGLWDEIPLTWDMEATYHAITKQRKTQNAMGAFSMP